MLKLGIAVANEGLASLVTRHLTKDKMFDIKNYSSSELTAINNISKQCDLMLIDNNIVKNPRGFCPLKKPSCISDSRSRLYQLGFSHSQGTDLLAELIYEVSISNSKFVLKKCYESLAKKYSVNPAEIKNSILGSYRNVQASSRVLDKFTGLKEFVWWIIEN